MMEWNSRDGIAKLLVAFEKELHQCVSQDLLSPFCSYFLENVMKFPSISTKTTSIVTDSVGRHQLSHLIGVNCGNKICKTWSNGME